MSAPEWEPEPGEGVDPASAALAARAALVREIVASGALDDDPDWRRSFADVPRHLFVPYYYVATPGGYERLWGEDPDPERRARWLLGAYADTPLATRVRDGELLSSSSQPSLMAKMLAELQIGEGDAVLEIGAGTGYNAALLSHRLGDSLVTTVDLEPEITESARSHLATAGYRPAVLTGDGWRGCAERAPYDRIMATCTVSTVPRMWLQQCRPHARILAPLATGLIALRVRDAGHAEGRFLQTPAYFVPLRGGVEPEAAPGFSASPNGLPHERSTYRSQYRSPYTSQYIGGLPRKALQNELFRFLLSLTEGVLDPHEALALWRREDRPARERFGVTVSGADAWAWLDDPEGPYAWPLP